MKTLIIILLTLSSVLQAQQPWKQYRNDQIKITTLMATSIALNAYGDGLNMIGKKDWGHTMNAASILCLLAIPLTVEIEKSIQDIYPWIFKYTFLRVAMFDPIINKTIGEDMFYLANSSFSDKVIKQMSPPEIMNATARTVFLTLGVTIQINTNHRPKKAKYPYNE